jgi:Protein of unknown function (DUF2917)
MTTHLIPKVHQTKQPGVQRLAAHEVSSLPVAAQPRCLWVQSGSVWVTQVKAVTDNDLPEDIWLASGQSLAMPAGSAWLLEAWQPAELCLTLPLPAPVKRRWRGFSWRRACS